MRLSYQDADNDGSIDPNTEIVKESNYYPFGLSHKGYNNNVSSFGNSVAKRYMFGGKEYNEELGLDWYDITARNYDPALGRWMNIDLLAEVQEDFTPYHYSYNSPIT
ncbi:RHS repeat-associated core domain-containing protein, partial [Maribacter sp. 2-571]|uniref:RHS repeat-associated core domain-containing protein n=1 Tax=Maribacter sp. 2-571 TaxID=3417569 RepID=UPI003D3434FC